MKDYIGNIVPNCVMARVLPKGQWNVKSSRADIVSEVRKPEEAALVLREGQQDIVRARLTKEMDEATKSVIHVVKSINAVRGSAACGKKDDESESEDDDSSHVSVDDVLQPIGIFGSTEKETAAKARDEKTVEGWKVFSGKSGGKSGGKSECKVRCRVLSGKSEWKVSGRTAVRSIRRDHKWS